MNTRLHVLYGVGLGPEEVTQTLASRRVLLVFELFLPPVSFINCTQRAVCCFVSARLLPLYPR